MAQPDQKLVTPASLVVDLILVVAFFIFMFWVLRVHVPSNDKTDIAIWAAAGSSCMTGVFWLCIQMFRVVFKAQRAAKRKV